MSETPQLLGCEIRRTVHGNAAMVWVWWWTGHGPLAFCQACEESHATPAVQQSLLLWDHEDQKLIPIQGDLPLVIMGLLPGIIHEGLAQFRETARVPLWRHVHDN